MIKSIKNKKLTIKINSKGAELWSIKDKQGHEYLWQGDKNFWADRAINIFPYVARLTGGKYTLGGKEYRMGSHGFVKDLEFKVESQEENQITFLLKHSIYTLEQYPYQFNFRISYQIVETELKITYSVENMDKGSMYFGLGGHPGFNLPLDDQLEFEDYYLEFQDPTDLIQVGMSKDCFVSGEDKIIALKNGNMLPLTHDLFDNDAIILKEMPKEVILKSNKSTRRIKMTYPKMNYLGIWHTPGTKAPYICIEPWTSLPSRKDVVEDLAKQADLVLVEAGKTYNNSWTIDISN